MHILFNLPRLSDNMSLSEGNTVLTNISCVLYSWLWNVLVQ